MQRQSFLKDQILTDEVSGYSEGNYEVLSEWYRQATANYYSPQIEELAVTYGNKHHFCRTTISCLSYAKSELNQIDNGQYELEVFANFSYNDSLICRPFQSQQLQCFFEKRKIMTKDPLVLFYHCPQYRDLLIFIEFQLLVPETGPVRLGYCQLNPYEQNATDKEMPILLGWPLDHRHKRTTMGSCYFTHQTSIKMLSNLQNLLPPLTIVSNGTKVPCCKGGKLPVEKLIEMQYSTMISVDMIRIEGSEYVNIPEELQKLSEKKSKLQAKAIKVTFQEYELQIGLHNTWTVIGEGFTRPLDLHQNKQLVDPGSSMNINIYNTRPICLLATLSCKYKVDTNSEHLKKIEKKKHPLCWFMFPLDLFKELNLISIVSLGTPVFNVSSFYFKKPVKLTCRVKHPNFMNYRQTREPRHNVSIDPAKIFQMEQTKTSKWKTVYKTDRGNAIEDIQTQNKRIIREQQRLEKQLSTKLYKLPLRPTGKKVYIEDMSFIPSAIQPQKVVGRTLIAHIKLESFLPYFKNLRNNSSFDYYFIPRSIQIKFQILNKVHESKRLLLPDSAKFGMLCILTRADFKQGKSSEANEIIKLQIELKDEGSVARLNRYNLIAVVYDAESKLVYAQSQVPLVKLIQVGTSKRSRLELMEKNQKELRGAICIDVHTTTKLINPNANTSQQPLSTNLIANQLSDKVRIQSRIDNYKKSKKLTSMDSQQLKTKELELELIKQYKETKIKKFARKAAELTIFKNLQKIQCQSCIPSFFIWEYTNNEGSLNNDYKLVIEDSDSTILAVEQMHMVRTLPEFEEVCKILNTQAKHFIEADYKNEFYLKNNEKAKLILKFLTYRVPHTAKDIDPHSIKLRLLRNTIPCGQQEVLIQPNPPDINNIFIFYQVLSDIVELEFDELFSIRYMSNYVLSIYRGSVSKWVKNRLVVSINCESAGIIQFMMVIYKDKTRLSVLNISKIIVYADEGLEKSLRLGESYQYNFRLSSPKFGIARLETTHPNLVCFDNPIVSVSAQQTIHNLTVFPEELGRQTILVSAVDYETCTPIAMFVLSLSISEVGNMSRLHHQARPFSVVRDSITVENTQKAEELFRIKCTSSLVKFETDEVLVAARTSRLMRFQIEPAECESCFRAYIFVYSSSNLLLKSYQVEILYIDPLLESSDRKD